MPPGYPGSIRPTRNQQWFIDSYSLVLAVTLLPAGSLGDRVGRKKVLAGSLALFGVASLACAYASSVGELIAARAVLGLAAAAILPLVLGVIPVMFSPAERPKAIALVGGATFAGYPVGPLLGGWLLDHFWWGSVFLINVPVVLLAVAAVAALMTESRSQQRPALDVLGVVLSSAGLAVLTYGVITAGQQGWGSGRAVAGRTVGLIGGQRLQSLAAGRDGDGDGAGGRRTVLSDKGPVTGGLLIMAVALAVGAGTSVTSGSAFGAGWLAAAGVGLGVALNGALGALSPERSGSGSALMTALRQVGATFGVAVLGTVLSAVYRSGVPVTRLPSAAAGAARDSVAGGVAVAHSAGSAPLLALVREAYVRGLDVMLWTCGGIALLSAGLALAFLPRRLSGPGAAADSASAVTAGV